MTPLYRLPSLDQKNNAIPSLFTDEQLAAHYNKHHKAYIEHTNEFLKEGKLKFTNMLEYLSHDEMVDFLAAQNTGAIYNQVAQAWNHTFFWASLGMISVPPGNPESKPAPDLQETYAALDAAKATLKADWMQHAEKFFGSGWIWIAWDGKRDFKIMETPNGHNPLPTEFTPLLTMDMWEHAYYLDYKSEKKGYAEECWNTLNWEWARAVIADSAQLHQIENLMKSDSKT